MTAVASNWAVRGRCLSLEPFHIFAVAGIIIRAVPVDFRLSEADWWKREFCRAGAWERFDCILTTGVKPITLVAGASCLQGVPLTNWSLFLFSQAEGETDLRVLPRLRLPKADSHVGIIRWH